MHGSTTLGKRLRTLRLERGYSQQELANRAGLSVDLLSLLERDVRESMSWASMVKLARALDVDPGVIAGKKPALERVPGAAVLTVRDAVLNPSLLGIHPDHDREPAAASDLWPLLERAYGAYFGGEFGVLAADLPNLINEARLLHATDPQAGAPTLAHAWQLAACLLVHTGRDDAAAIAAERAINTAKDGDDRYRLATLYGTYSWVMLHQGRLHEAEQLAVTAAEEIEPSMSKSPPQQITAWGGLILNAAVASGGRADGDRAEEYLRIASAGAVRVGADRHDYWVSFGPSHVAVQTTHIMTALNKPDRALKAAAQVNRNVLFKVQYGRHLLNESRALLDRRRTEQAIEVAAHAHDISPEWFRHQGFAQTLTADIAERKARLSGPLRTLVQAFQD
ncbi:transcriptional regulator with XRE-family HTH domain [Streptosporangium becharense]|uniref:Transcriptional regulator with XRE-family HTH domain n=1 Tax=Streptosporangium becharense TaxID=1816182 RepID=A0A7W9MJ30_9ACTN|nr:helix-turn-helix transcriptional regulator [Streptosporangium becharense]MBB2913165.1 transcriptional regulator with XRE-family HTH domain [Streptosporangium becharense]MBB5822148.1 transcriptional regulator with XRE-family HTH domain [Streptosporangium becharense]